MRVSFEPRAIPVALGWRLCCLLIGLLPTETVLAQTLPVLVVLNLQAERAQEREMLETVDCLVDSTRETGAFGSVLGGSGTDDTSTGGPAALLAMDAGSAARIARSVGAQYAIYGSLGLDGNRRVLRIAAVEAATGNTLFEEERPYERLADIRNDCPRIARLLVETLPARNEPRTERAPPPHVAFRGFVRLGQEGVSRTSSIEGGSHLYVELVGELNKALLASLRYSAELLPSPFQSHLVSARLGVSVPLTRDIYCAVGFAYLVSTDYQEPPSHWIGVRFCPIYSGDADGLAIELLPFAVFLDPVTQEVAFTFELISIGFRVVNRP